jgi:hypothetical protein
MPISKEAAANVAMMVGTMRSQVHGLLSACDDTVERTRLENAFSALSSLLNFYIKQAGE